MSISKLEVIFCTFLAENNFVNALILFIRAKPILNIHTIVVFTTYGKNIITLFDLEVQK